ncbi:MAG: hypothetical protein ACJAWL_002974 [Motiliproteus sp.]|jgi:hypothetical protein
MKKNTPYTLNSGAIITVKPRRMHGKDTHLSIILDLEDQSIEVICSEQSVVNNGVRGYFSFSAQQIERKQEKRNDRLREWAAERKIELNPYVVTGRDANCITIHEHLITGLS